jgi:hypothetical protein
MQNSLEKEKGQLKGKRGENADVIKEISFHYILMK